MRYKREKAIVAVSAPLMVAGLVAAALANGWIMRLGGASMVVGASLALAVTGSGARRLGWSLAVVGGLVALSACF